MLSIKFFKQFPFFTMVILKFIFTIFEALGNIKDPF